VADRAALVTGGSSGIGLAIARGLGEDGYALTLSARRPEKLEAAAEGLRADGLEVKSVPTQMTDHGEIAALVAAHRDAYGRMDVLVNSAGVGIGEAMDQITAKKLDIQVGANLRGLILATSASLPMLREAGAEHGKALIVNLASVAGKVGQPWLSVYSATKGAVINFTEAMHKELGTEGIKSTALCPGFVDTALSDFIKGQIPAEEMITVQDIAEAVRLLLKVSPTCIIPEIQFIRPGDAV
jgi:short-subunit dehydrogenase